MIPATIATDRPQFLRLALAVCLGLIVLGIAVDYGLKASRSASAIVRWRGLIDHLVRGNNVYNEPGLGGAFPNPPVLGIALWPLTLLPPLVAALTWFFLKVAMAGVTMYWSIRLATADQFRIPTRLLIGLIMLVSRPLLSDLDHGNVNILILFLVTAGLWAFRQGRDWLAGAAIALGTAFKLTPALFIPYFAYKRQWRVVAGSLIGLAVFLVIVPGAVLGFQRNLWLVRAWYSYMVRPYLVEGKVETLQVNQSLPGVWMRLVTDSPGVKLQDDTVVAVNLLSLDHETAWWILRGLIACLVLWIAWLARAGVGDRADWRLAVEFALVFLAMLMISERSWKHHFVALVLPYTVLIVHMARPACGLGMGWFLRGTLWMSFLLMASTSAELGGLLTGGIGHKYAQGYGLFCAAALVTLPALSALLLSGSRGREDSF